MPILTAMSMYFIHRIAERLVEMLFSTHFKATLEEPTVPVDPTSNQHAEQLPTYNAYSVDGEVTAPLVYVNYGIPADYEELERLGISVKGAIVLARYGMSWRGIKPKVAAKHGAVGCIIYSDPHEDGYFRGDVFPTGAWRPLQGVQRGSVMDMVLYPGDPLTPGVAPPKTPNASRWRKPRPLPGFLFCPSPTVMRCHCSSLCKGQWRRRRGADRSPSLTTCFNEVYGWHFSSCWRLVLRCQHVSSLWATRCRPSTICLSPKSFPCPNL